MEIVQIETTRSDRMKYFEVQIVRVVLPAAARQRTAQPSADDETFVSFGTPLFFGLTVTATRKTARAFAEAILKELAK